MSHKKRNVLPAALDRLRGNGRARRGVRRVLGGGTDWVAKEAHEAADALADVAHIAADRVGHRARLAAQVVDQRAHMAADSVDERGHEIASQFVARVKNGAAEMRVLGLAGQPGAMQRLWPAGGQGNVGRAERVISLVAGVPLVVVAARRRDAASGALGLAGAEMVYRGVTGHCPIYSALGVNRVNGQSRLGLPF